ncbi:MAG: DNA polymerase III subunit beta, partial [Methylocystaceae bacterium]
MKVTIERAALLRALGHVHRVVERRTTIPILANVLIDAKAGALLLKATDLDLEITERAAADVAQDGATTLPAHTLYDIVRKLPEGAQVSLEATGEQGQLLLRSGRSRFHLQSLPESDFPDVTSGDFSHRFSLPPADLKKLIEKTQFAISSEETRYYLNGIFLHSTEVEGHLLLRAVATDGHRLARVELPAPAGSAGMPGVILPRKAVAEIQRLGEDAQGAVAIELSTNKMRFSFGETVLTTKLIDGTFPDYGRVIPANNDKRLTVERDAFAKAV